MQTEAIYKGATRPAMKMGIPLVPLVVLFGTGMLLMAPGTTGRELLCTLEPPAQQGVIHRES